MKVYVNKPEKNTVVKNKFQYNSIKFFIIILTDFMLLKKTKILFSFFAVTFFFKQKP